MTTLAAAGAGVRPARADGAGGQVAGMVVSSMGQTEAPATAMARLRANGVNTVSLFVWWWADQPSSTSLRPYDGTESDQNLTAEISAAHAAGLRVILTPIFDCGGCEGGWRGVMEPSSIPSFFASYRSFMDHYAQLAQANGVWLLFVGSEMTSLGPQTAEWESVIGSARQYYSGLIGYEQNWDVVGQPQFLGDVDVVGVSAYYPLDDAADPSEAQLLADWNDSRASGFAGRNWVGGLVHLAASTGKPILFGEVGYTASDYAARQPFSNNVYSENQALQANLYQALLQTFSGYSWWMGTAWWEWSDAPADAGRTPMGKTAETLLHDWYASGWRPPAPGSTSTASSSNPSPPGAPSPSAPNPSTNRGVPGSSAGPAPAAGLRRPGSAAAPGPLPSGAVAAAPAAGSSAATRTLPAQSSPASNKTVDATAPGVTQGRSHQVVLAEGAPGGLSHLDADHLQPEAFVAILALAGSASAMVIILLGQPAASRRRREPLYPDELD